MKDYFSRFKFQGDYLLREVFARELAKSLKSYKEMTVVPIPLSHESYQERQFNQVTALLEAAKVPYTELLGKHHIAKQSSKNRQERLSSENPFYILPQVTEFPKAILLIDDIYTTGATLIKATEVLKQAGVDTIKTFSLAR